MDNPEDGIPATPECSAVALKPSPVCVAPQAPGHWIAISMNIPGFWVTAESQQVARDRYHDTYMLLGKMKGLSWVYLSPIEQPKLSDMSDETPAAPDPLDISTLIETATASTVDSQSPIG